MASKDVFSLNTSSLKNSLDHFNTRKDEFNTTAYATYKSSYLCTSGNAVVERIKLKVDSLYNDVNKAFLALVNYTNSYYNSSENFESSLRYEKLRVFDDNEITTNTKMLLDILADSDPLKAISNLEAGELSILGWFENWASKDSWASNTTGNTANSNDSYTGNYLDNYSVGKDATYNYVTTNGESYQNYFNDGYNYNFNDSSYTGSGFSSYTSSFGVYSLDSYSTTYTSSFSNLNSPYSSTGINTTAISGNSSFAYGPYGSQALGLVMSGSSFGTPSFNNLSSGINVYNGLNASRSSSFSNINSGGMSSFNNTTGRSSSFNNASGGTPSFNNTSRGTSNFSNTLGRISSFSNINSRGTSSFNNTIGSYSSNDYNGASYNTSSSNSSSVEYASYNFLGEDINPSDAFPNSSSFTNLNSMRNAVRRNASGIRTKMGFTPLMGGAGVAARSINGSKLNISSSNISSRGKGPSSTKTSSSKSYGNEMTSRTIDSSSTSKVSPNRSNKSELKDRKSMTSSENFAISKKKQKEYRTFAEYYDDNIKFIKKSEVFLEKNSYNILRIILGYFSDSLTTIGNYQMINGILRDNVFDFENRKITIHWTEVGKEVYTFKQFEETYCSNQYESVKKLYKDQSLAAVSLQEAIRKNTINNRLVLERGLDFEALKDYGIKEDDSAQEIYTKLKNSIYSDKGFMVCIPSVEEESLPKAFKDKKVRLILEVSPDTCAIDLSSINYLKYHVLLQDNLFFKTTKVDKKNDIIYIYMTNMEDLWKN